MSGNNPNNRIRETIINITNQQSSPYSDGDHETQELQPPPLSSKRNSHAQTSPKVEEIRKVIRHILTKLGKRKRPAPSIAHLGEQLRSNNVSCQFENEDTVELLFRLREVLLLCQDMGEKLGIQILTQSERTPSNSPASSRSNSPGPSPKSAAPSRSFEASPAHAHSSSTKKDSRVDFEKILFLLDELVINDCRYRSANPKPTQPPYMMQSVLVDIAIVLVNIRSDSVGLYNIGATMLPAFETFNDGALAGKLLSFYIDILLPKLMACKEESKARGDRFSSRKKQQASTYNSVVVPSTKHQHTQSVTPTINIQSADVEDHADREHSQPIRSSNLTIDTRLSQTQSPINSRSPVNSRSPAIQSQHSHQQLMETHHAYALFTPLLFFMIQYLNPYLSSSRLGTQTNLSVAISRQSSSINNFHCALRFMIATKPDLYFDILDVISHSTPEVKFRACQVLFHYYNVSVGHVSVAEPLPKLGIVEEIAVLERNRKRQEFESNRQQEQQHSDPTFLETMIGTNVAGINRKYRNGANTRSPQLNHRGSGASDSNDDDYNDDFHVWYPHMFTKPYDPTDAGEQSNQQVPIAPCLPDSGVIDYANGSYCNECYKEMQDYGLRCYHCKCNVHYNCFNQRMASNDLDIMLYVKEGGVQKVVSPQFCHIPPQPRFPDPHDVEYGGHGVCGAQVDIFGHHFHLVNLYTIMLCASCVLPLWGISQQGYRCSSCNRFVHPECLANAEKTRETNLQYPVLHHCQPYKALLESDTKITQKELSKQLFLFYGNLVPKSESELTGRSFEEVATMLNVLLLQENILHCGVAAGCLLVCYLSDDPLTSNTRDNGRLTFSQPCPVLRRGIELCITYLESGNCKGSSFLSDFYSNRYHSLGEWMLSKEDYLSHLAAMMKSLAKSSNEGTIQSVVETASEVKRRSAGDARGFLQVVPNPFTERWSDDDDFDDESCLPQEIMDRSAMLTWIMENLHMKSKKAGEIMLQHMCNLGLFERKDAGPILFTSEITPTGASLQSPTSSPLSSEAESVQCVFPVPFSIDCSPTVETLINSIEACFEDIDITLNECGMLLLVRRCWPDPFMSRYTTERLIHAILTWIFQEDEKLSTLHAEYTSNKHQIPGVRQNKYTHAAQLALLSRTRGSLGERQRQSIAFGTAAGMSSGAGSAYVTIRTALRDRYIYPWLAAVHAMDKNAYASILSDTIERIVDGRREECMIPEWMEQQNHKKTTSSRYDEYMGYILKLKLGGLTFTSQDSMLERWLNKAYDEFEAKGILKDNEPVDVSNLARLCSTKNSASKYPGPASVMSDSTHPYDAIVNLFEARELESIDQGIRWLSLFMHSGIGVSSEALTKISRLLIDGGVAIRTLAEFLKLVWFQAVNVLKVSTSRAAIIDIVGYINEKTSGSLFSINENQNLPIERLASTQKFVKYSVVLTCYAYNCPLANITELDVVPYFGDHVARVLRSKRASLDKDNTSPMHADENTPIIRCMIKYLRYDQINVRTDVIKMFYALIYWGFGISNKSDFATKCMPALIPAIWELLPPNHDHISDINLNLLMKLLSIDVRYFQACVYEIFEDSNWEVRYQGLDHLYGLFTKMDYAFQTKWLQMLSHLGPVFSYFVGCLWDKEENVRSKTFALIRTFGTLHLRSAFWCWEAYFMAASDRQKIPLISLMINLHAIFPEWQVLQWEALLGALEMKRSDKSDTRSLDILDQYMRSDQSTKDKDNDSDSAAEIAADSENSKVLMLSLALQMLSNHISITTTQISRFKLILVEQMGFNNCGRFEDASDESVVTFGEFCYDPKDTSQDAMMISTSRGLKKVMDSFSPLPAETVASMPSDLLEQNRLKLTENSSPGIHFIDVVLKMFNSSVDLTKVSHNIVKIWLEIILIVVYKHKILEREYEISIVNCMKQIIELLTKEISEENKLLIFEILKCLLRRSEHLTAMILLKQIMALGKLMTKLGGKVTEPVYLKAKQFLKAAFLRFAGAGLFVLLFKNRTVLDSSNQDVDLFYILRAIIDPEDVVPDEEMREAAYLRDQPIRDVLDKLMKQQMERSSFSTVLYNSCRYIETVHSHPYSETILNDYAGFLTTLVKHTSGWRRSEWNINPVLTMSALLLKEHPYHFSILLSPIQLLFKHGIANCDLEAESIVKLMAAYSAISSIPGTEPQNVFAETIVEEAKAGMANRLRLNRATLMTLLQLILWDNDKQGQDWYTSIENELLGEMAHDRQRSHYFKDKLPFLLDPVVNFIKSQVVVSPFTENDFRTYNTASHILVLLCKEDPKYLGRALGLQRLDETRYCLRFLTWFILALLAEGADECLKGVLEFEDVFTDLLTQTLNSVHTALDNSEANFADSTSSEALTLCFLVLKCWLLLRSRSATMDINGDGKEIVRSDPLMLWMSVWPALRRILYGIESANLFLPGNNGLSIWNMFLSLLQFLFGCRSSIVLVNANEWSCLLDTLYAQLSATNGIDELMSSSIEETSPINEFRRKVTKVRQMFEVPSIEVPADILIEQLYLGLRSVMQSQADNLSFPGATRVMTTAMGVPQ
ncbi:hypothetical protein CLU79DRAFT_736311 [Phycomyces nitens]|nr:hypothetical protein CLU79DRAFT_736311 [Phycomyces nitens]